ncbi:hypothetical protein [Vibrio jasicida]|uniref:hypothetical protein n=1 Tax=Vibrio jasicida TaxID=766224 RepID=UPI0005F0315E|nr:hypothetical protein [Vibrio jasicida]
MTNFKLATSALLLSAFAGTVSAGDVASSTVVWNGIVPSSIPSGDRIITGFNGNLTALTGTILADTTGKFESSEIVLEAHEYTPANADSGEVEVIGDLKASVWEVVRASVTYNGAPVTGVDFKVYANKTEVAVGGQFGETGTGYERVTWTMSQVADLPVETVGGATAQASLTVVITDA